MSWFSKPKEEKPSEEDYDLNGLNEIHSRAEKFRNVQDYTAMKLMVEERIEYEKEHGMDVRFDYEFHCFKRRR